MTTVRTLVSLTAVPWSQSMLGSAMLSLSGHPWALSWSFWVGRSEGPLGRTRVAEAA